VELGERKEEIHRLEGDKEPAGHSLYYLIGAMYKKPGVVKCESEVTIKEMESEV
jgi:hypothetical protein